eukprot:893141-Pelagomonas_calceolata.AAC.10
MMRRGVATHLAKTAAPVQRTQCTTKSNIIASLLKIAVGVLHPLEHHPSCWTAAPSGAPPSQGKHSTRHLHPHLHIAPAAFGLLHLWNTTLTGQTVHQTPASSPASRTSRCRIAALSGTLPTQAGSAPARSQGVYAAAGALHPGHLAGVLSGPCVAPIRPPCCDSESKGHTGSSFQHQLGRARGRVLAGCVLLPHKLGMTWASLPATKATIPGGAFVQGRHKGKCSGAGSLSCIRESKDRPHLVSALLGQYGKCKQNNNRSEAPVPQGNKNLLHGKRRGGQDAGGWNLWHAGMVWVAEEQHLGWFDQRCNY